jgi:tetratricopeptide (TPR) repeat protein
MPRAVRLLIAVIAVAVCVSIVWCTSRLAFSRIMARYATKLGNVAAANQAVAFANSDAEPHLLLASLLKASGALSESIPEFEKAAALRPRDYYHWLELGMARDENNDQSGALAAFNESVRLAPFYGQPLWQRGNLFLRMARYDEGFRDLRAAVASNPDFTPAFIDLCFNVSRSDSKLTEELVQPTTPAMHLAFAKYLARHTKPSEALEHLKLAGTISEEDRKEIIAVLISNKSFAQAFQIWNMSGTTSEATVHDGGFEGPLSLGESGFGWSIRREVKGVSLSHASDAQSGARSLQIEFTGESDPAVPIVSQLIIVQPNTKYQISFAAQTKEIVSGGLPYATVTDATEDGTRLGQSVPFPKTTSSWQPMLFQFTTGSRSTAVILNFERQSCSSQPCPAFGTLWLDSIGIQAV